MDKMGGKCDTHNRDERYTRTCVGAKPGGNRLSGMATRIILKRIERIVRKMRSLFYWFT
jgi:hypothetical protein